MRISHWFLSNVGTWEPMFCMRPVTSTWDWFREMLTPLSVTGPHRHWPCRQKDSFAFLLSSNSEYLICFIFTSLGKWYATKTSWLGQSYGRYLLIRSVVKSLFKYCNCESMYLRLLVCPSVVSYMMNTFFPSVKSTEQRITLYVSSFFCG